MSLSVTRARVKEKCGITASTYDSTIDNLIAELVPAIEYAVRAEHIGDTLNTGLQATLNLGTAEIVCAEFLDQLGREPGASDTVTLGELTLVPSDAPAKALKAAGWRRIKPFLKPDPSQHAEPGVLVAPNRVQTEEAGV